MVWECYTPSWWENNILEKDGSKTPRWERARTVNAELHALTKDFARFRSIGTRLEGFSEYEPCLRTPPLFGCGGDMEMVGQWFYS